VTQFRKTLVANTAAASLFVAIGLVAYLRRSPSVSVSTGHFILVLTLAIATVPAVSAWALRSRSSDRLRRVTLILNWGTIVLWTVAAVDSISRGKWNGVVGALLFAWLCAINIRALRTLLRKPVEIA
jgi:Ca2+/Na+ antiporter